MYVCLCKGNSDCSRDLLEDILEVREEHIDRLETQLELIAKTGMQNYLQPQM